MSNGTSNARRAEPAGQVPSAIANALRQGAEIGDEMFDLVYPAEQRYRSWMHWTPIDVALRACALLAWKPDVRVLDIGSGVGKVCLVGALTTEASWFGIEQDAVMVQAATAAAAALGVEESATFMNADATTVEWGRFDAFYLFNPFVEALIVQGDPLARRDAYVATIDVIQRRLAVAPLGTRVVTYCGFGGDMPADYELIHQERAHDDELVVWCRTARGRARKGATP